MVIYAKKIKSAETNGAISLIFSVCTPEIQLKQQQSLFSHYIAKVFFIIFFPMGGIFSPQVKNNSCCHIFFFFLRLIKSKSPRGTDINYMCTMIKMKVIMISINIYARIVFFPTWIN